MDYTETLLINNKKQQALNVLVDGISNYPDESVLYYRYSALMLEMGNEMDAESILLLALEIDPDQSSQLFNFFPEAGNFEGIMDLIENYK
jgi:predicted Zn-dependent protease